MTRTWRLGPPQIFAGLLLLAFAVQSVWTALNVPLDRVSPFSEHAVLGGLQLPEKGFLREGSRFSSYRADTIDNSPLVFALAGLTLEWFPFGDVRARLLFVLFGLLRGAAIWYVARRLYGNAGGYVALTLYCFSVRMVADSGRISPEVTASWGFFGIVFVAIALSHTLHAPLRNRIWRTVLLAAAIFLGVGSEYSVRTGVALAVGFVLYLVPGRRAAALGSLVVALVAATLGIWALYGFSPYALRILWQTRTLGFEPDVTPLFLHSKLAGLLLPPHDAALAALAVIAVATYAAWPRSRYFGNTAPLIVASALGALGLFMPSSIAWHHLVKAYPFIFVFIGGMFADLLDIPGRRPVYRAPVLALTWLLLISHAALGLAALPGFPPT